MPDRKADVADVLDVQELRRDLLACCQMMVLDKEPSDADCVKMAAKLEEFMVADALPIIGNRNLEKSRLTWAEMRLLVAATCRTALKILEEE